MHYKLSKATTKNTEEIIQYKLASILNYTQDMSKEEQKRIISYVHESIPRQIHSYQMVTIKNKVIGCLLTTNTEKGILLDEIYIKNEYQNKGIGTDIIKKLMKKEEIIYLWVYKNNIQALNLYHKLSFKIIEETESRYYMKYEGEKYGRND